MLDIGHLEEPKQGLVLSSRPNPPKQCLAGMTIMVLRLKRLQILVKPKAQNKPD
jgi:hypothetical protein